MKHSNGLRALFSASIAAFLAEMKPHLVKSASFSTGFKPFDCLTREQQFVAVHEVCLSLLQDNTASLKRTAYHQATLLALFDCIERNVRLEILECRTAFRTLLLAAHREIYGSVDHGVTRDCNDFKQWDAFLKCISRKLVDEESLEISEKVYDLPPELTTKYLRNFGIEKDFYLAAPSDPAFFHTAILVNEIYGMCRTCLNRYVNESMLPDFLDVLNNNADHSFQSN